MLIMMNLCEGQKVPDVTFSVRENGEWQKVNTDTLFKGKTVVLFALPGAFTPNCSSDHLPRFNELSDTFKENGVDRVICLSVNDPYVMEQWREEQKADGIYFLPDGNGEFSAAMGLLVNKSDLGMGQRSVRYSMLVKNSIVEKMFIEAQEPSDPYKVSDADTMLKYINPQATTPARVAMFSKPGCPYCALARKMLKDNGYHFECFVPPKHGISHSSLHAVNVRGTTPQIYIDGQHIGGSDELAKWLSR